MTLLVLLLLISSDSQVLTPDSSNMSESPDTVRDGVVTSTESQSVGAVGLDLNQCLSLTGLLLVTIGSIGAALGSPSPTYKRDGSVATSGVSDKDKRIRIYKWQQAFPWCLTMIGVGAFLQGVAIVVKAYF
jgi:hypothetical protein